MLHPVTVRFLVVAAFGWLLAGPAGALTLGRAHGAALIGRPLEVAIPVTVDAPTGEAPCASADVFYGDRQVTPSVRVETTGPGLGTVRVKSSERIDEPMVTVTLKVGCQQAVTRRYVLLSELPPQDEPVAPRTIAVPPLVLAAASTPVVAPETTPRRRDIAKDAPAVVATPESGRPRASARPAPAPRAKRPVAAVHARLKLEPLDLDVEREPSLRLASQLAPPAAVAPQQRQALASLWQALQRTPEQAIEDVARLQAMQRDLESVRGAIRENAAAITELRSQAERDRKGRDIASALVVGLAAVLGILVAVLGWRWYRARQLEQVGRWFEVHRDTVQPQVPPTQPGVPVAAKAPAVPPAPLKAVAAATSVRVTPPARPPAAPKAAPAPKPARGPASTWGGEFPTTRGGPLRTVGVQELIDVHDKADFFLSIGETDQAVGVLEAHVHDHVETGALAWLDLLELYHTLGRRSQFDRLRSEFRQRFAAQVPDFERFGEPSGTLDDYGRALSRIVALWPSPKVLDVIDESIFHKEGKAGGEPFSLAAYRELVLLRHIARDMTPDAQAESTQQGPSSTFADTSLEALNAAGRPSEPPLTERERLMIPPPSARLGVDIDLGDPQAGPSELQPLDFDMSTFDPAGSEGEDTRP
jgi:hypothetical protein